jgi:hypothetical protein
MCHIWKISKFVMVQATKGHEYWSPNYRIIYLIFNLSKTILDLRIEGRKLGQGPRIQKWKYLFIKSCGVTIYHIQQIIIIPYVNFEEKNDGKMQLTLQHQNCSRWVSSVPLICNGSPNDFINWINLDKKKNNE